MTRLATASGATDVARSLSDSLEACRDLSGGEETALKHTVGYETLGDPDVPGALTAAQTRRQAEVERLWLAARQQHFHRFTVGEQAGNYYSHTHEGSGEPGHIHPGRQAFPVRSDGGYWEETGPCLGSTPPEPVARNIASAVASLLRRAQTPSHMLMRWRLRLYCGHLVERTANVEHKTVHQAFMGYVACAECGLEPATIIGASPIDLAGKPPAPPSRSTGNRESVERRLARAEGEVVRLRAELERHSNAAGIEPSDGE